MRHGLNTALDQFRQHRSRFVYTTAERKFDYRPQLFPPLRNAYFSKYAPDEGQFSFASDLTKVQSLMADLLPMLEDLRTAKQEGHSVPDGHGVLTNLYGNEYTGEFLGGCFHGHGVLRSSNGTVYEGELAHGAKHGRGVHADGTETQVCDILLPD